MIIFLVNGDSDKVSSNVKTIYARRLTVVLLIHIKTFAKIFTNQSIKKSHHQKCIEDKILRLIRIENLVDKI